MSDRIKLNNIMTFIGNNIICAGYGYVYKRAIIMLYNGYPLIDVTEWYNNILKENKYE